MDKKVIVARIDELMREKHITGYQLRENAEISTTVYQWRKNAQRDKERVPSLRSIEKICNYLGVSLAYFFSFESSERENVQNRELYRAIESLTDEQRSAVSEIVALFNKTNGK
jgi:transcriptional regulator with XRE-family HTH domain